MTTLTISTGPAPRRTGWLLLAVILAGMIVLGSLSRRAPGRAVMPAGQVPLPQLTAHALKHADAHEAWDWVGSHGAFCRFDCPDGRTRYVCGMPGGRWAVVVVSAANRLVTAFTSDQEYARGVIDACKNPWRYVHP